MANYLTTSISPMMLNSKSEKPIRMIIDEISRLIKFMEIENYIPAVGHLNTAKIIQKKLGLTITPFARINICLNHGDDVIAIIPQFRVEESREYTDKEIENTLFRYFLGRVIYI